MPVVAVYPVAVENKLEKYSFERFWRADKRGRYT